MKKLKHPLRKCPFCGSKDITIGNISDKYYCDCFPQTLSIEEIKAILEGKKRLI